MNKKIILKLDPLGQPTLEVDGATGQSCFEMTRAIEDALGGVADRTEKPEALLENEQDDTLYFS